MTACQQVDSRNVSVRPAWKSRLGAVAFYLGLAPLLWRCRIRREDPFVRYHAAQALATVLLLLVVLLVEGILFPALSCLLVCHRDLYESLPLPDGWSPPLRDALLLSLAPLGWLLAWLGGLTLALAGSWRVLPLVGRLARKPRLLRLALVGNGLALVVVVLTATLAVHASSLTRDDDQPAAAYLLYDDMGAVPRWVFNLGFYRVALAARARWGPDQVVVAPLDERHLRQALRHGRLVCLAVHGREGDVLAPGLRITPCPSDDDGTEPPRGLWVAEVDEHDRSGSWTFLAAGADLRFVYNSACDGGSKATEWSRALAPAEVRTFDRLSAALEHVVWLWAEAPRHVREMD